MGFELVLPVEPRFMASAVAVDDWAAEGSLVLVFEHVPLELEFSFEVCLDLASGPGAHEARVVFSGVPVGSGWNHLLPPAKLMGSFLRTS